MYWLSRSASRGCQYELKNGRIIDSYKIVFKDGLKPGYKKESLITLLYKFLNIPVSKGHLLFSGRALALKKGENMRER